MIDEVVLYEPQKSASFGHALKRKDKYKAYKELEKFIDEHLLVKLDPYIKLQVGEGSSFYASCYQKVVDAFGLPHSKSGHVSHWEVPAGEIKKAIDIGLQLRDKNAIDPFRLNFMYSVRWNLTDKEQSVISSFTRAAEPRFHSRLSVSIGHNIFVQPYFLFPYRYDDPNLVFFLKRLTKDLPFNLKSNYFRRVSKNKTNDRLKFSKIEISWPVA